MATIQRFRPASSGHRSDERFDPAALAPAITTATHHRFADRGAR
jgi:hypothetical protein